MYIQKRLGKTVWEFGCDSWYRTASGKNSNNWPGLTFDYRRRSRYFDPGNYNTHIPNVEPATVRTG